MPHQSAIPAPPARQSAHPLVVAFPGGREASGTEVGGKAASLIRMCDAGLPVPPGAIITSDFFAPWFETVKATAAWRELIAAVPDARDALSPHVKAHAVALPLTEEQRTAMQSLRTAFGNPDSSTRFAVRSSSPEEDLAAASFAGTYETRLGVTTDGLEDAIRACFASALDPRVLAYKAERGFDIGAPSIAVIVQQQVASEVAGVAFSLNPMTNDYDEAVIDANWGLGTSVVDGRVTPDHFVMNKVDYVVVEETRGNKRVSTWLDPDAGTVDREQHRAAERTLSDAQLAELTDLIVQVEGLYDAPVDIEWAFADDRLHLLQARPITTFVPLPPEMVTRPGAPRLLYGDAALSKGMTTSTAISPLGLDSMQDLFATVVGSLVGPAARAPWPRDALVFFAGGRMYMNYSNILWLASPKMLAKGSVATDALMAETLAGIDPARYRAAKRPPWVGLRLAPLAVRALWNMRGFMLNMFRSLVAPEAAARALHRRLGAFEEELLQQLHGGLPLEEFRRTYGRRMAGEIFEVAMPALLAGAISPGPIVRPKTEEEHALVDSLTSGVTGDVVVEMGIALHEMARVIDPADLDDLDHLAERIRQRQVAPELMTAWDAFMAKFGWRGPMEMDLASPRYADDPRLALRQMSFMSVSDEGFSPAAAHRRLVAERQRAYEQLARRPGMLRRMLLRRVHRLIGLFAGTRDAPKHLVVLYNYVIRRRALEAGARLAGAGRIDAAEDVFMLTFSELAAASGDEVLDLRAIVAERRQFHDRLSAQVTRFPAVIDSRGRILRPPPRQDADGLLRGMPVSRGVVAGPVKILHSPHEKRVEPGDVLVAYTTDPGWTPLFVNAAAIVLEVGGALQHGAVVAREYGKPCVVGIDQVVTTLSDGMLVEVDGTMGTVRVLS